MANEKKYSAQEAAIAVLSKAQELLSKSELFKAEKLKKDGGIAAGIAAAGAAGGVPHTTPAGSTAGAISAMGSGFGKAESYCEAHAKDLSRKGDHKIVEKSECIKCMGKSENAELYESLEKYESLQKKEKAGENEIGTKFVKSDEAENKDKPSNPMKPQISEKPIERDYKDFETKPQDSKAPDHRQAAQTPPGANPKEQAEGNNPPAGAIPGNGIHKLMYFTGHIHAKKKMKKGIAIG